MLKRVWRWLKGDVEVSRKLDSYCEQEFLLRPIDGHPVRLIKANVTVTERCITYNRPWRFDTVEYEVEINMGGHIQSKSVNTHVNAHQAMRIIRNEYEI